MATPWGMVNWELVVRKSKSSIFQINQLNLRNLLTKKREKEKEQRARAFVS